MRDATKHQTDCRRVFGRYDTNCPRCLELANGASPRRGWSTSKDRDARFIAELRAHNCQKAGCGPVCTFGDW